MIRPRVRSYGESSTATLSPGRIRMKFLRILPEMCARTWCLFSNSTRNIAFGSGSTTVAITSIASSLGNGSLPSVSDRGQDLFFLVDDIKDLFRNLVNRFHAVNLMIDTQFFVKLHQRI